MIYLIVLKVVGSITNMPFPCSIYRDKVAMIVLKYVEVIITDFKREDYLQFPISFFLDISFFRDTVI